ncbi:MAG: flagellar protein FliS, partial [Planctomycetes bacterium]|nr:flagellar protein FliS [Planctomycetota bacterium]
YRRLVDANMQRDEDAVDDALRILRHQRETWALLIEKIAKEQAAPVSALVTANDRGQSTLSLEG